MLGSVPRFAGKRRHRRASAGNYEEVTHMLVKKTLEALHDKAHAGVVKERAAETVEILRAFRGSRRGSPPQGPQTHRLTAEFSPCVG